MVAALDAGLSEAGIVESYLADLGMGDANATLHLFDHLDVAKCLAELTTPDLTAAITLETAQQLVTIGADCVQTVAKDAGWAQLAGALSVVVGLGDSLVQNAWAAVDTAVGASQHVIDLQRAAPAPRVPSQFGHLGCARLVHDH